MTKNEQKQWIEFKESGLLWFINTTLHAFGWAIVIEVVDGEFISVCPMRTKMRGFSEKSNTAGYIKLSTYMKENGEKLLKESKE